jgi:hypothetical protein
MRTARASALSWHVQLLLWVLCALAAVFALPAWAQSRVWLDRDTITFGETTTLNIQFDASEVRTMPDLSELSRDFRIDDQLVQQQMAATGTGFQLNITVRLVLRPIREGRLEIPMLRFGREPTPRLILNVLPARNAQPTTADSQSLDTDADADGRPVFLESIVDTKTPYVQQTVGYIIRLYYQSGMLLEGRLDQDPPDGASLQKVGDDVETTVRIDDTFYKIVERRFLLIPERSGSLTIPPARFQGRALGVFDNVLDSQRQELRISSRPIALAVRPIPAAASQPWLPLRGLRLRYLETPEALRVGKGATVMVELVADGGTAAQLPELMLKTGSGAQVFAEAAQRDDRFEQGRPQATIVRRFSVLPDREGRLRIVGPRLQWWDAQAGIARTAALPDLNLRVTPGANANDPSAAINPDRMRRSSDGDSNWFGGLPFGRWVWAAVALAWLWLGALVVGWRIWSARGRTVAVVPRDVPLQSPNQSAPQAPQTLAHALMRGELIQIARTLCAIAMPPAADLDAVRSRLADPAQRAAIDALQRARWGDGDTASTLAALRTAFASGPRWRTPATVSVPVLLPPLYPEQSSER